MRSSHIPLICSAVNLPLIPLNVYFILHGRWPWLSFASAIFGVGAVLYCGTIWWRWRRYE